MYRINEYKNLTAKYGSFASWAIWDYNDDSNTAIITQNSDQLNARYILLGLNISGPLSNKPWLNFHGGSTHDRKLKFVCNDTTLRGSYMTDIFKGIEEVQAAQLANKLSEKIINENVNFFIQEMKDIKISDKSKFLLFGRHVEYYFNKYFRQYFRNDVIIHHHYSFYGITDKEWVESLWRKVNIDHNFDLTINKYQRTKLQINQSQKTL